MITIFGLKIGSDFAKGELPVAGDKWLIAAFSLAGLKALPWRRQDLLSEVQKGSKSSMGYARSALKFWDRKSIP